MKQPARAAIRLRRAIFEKSLVSARAALPSSDCGAAIGSGGQAIFNKSRSNSRSKAMSNGRSIKARPNGRFIKAFAFFYEGRSSQVARHPDLSRGLQVLYYLAQSVCHQKRAQWPFCQSQVQWPKYKAFAVLSRQKQPSGQTSRFEPRIASSIASRAHQAILSRPCPMAVLSKPLPFYQSRSSQVAKHPDLSRGLQIPF